MVKMAYLIDKLIVSFGLFSISHHTAFAFAIINYCYINS